MPTPPLIHIGFYKTATSWMQKYLFTGDHGFTIALNPMAVQIHLINPRPFRFSPETVQSAYGEGLAAQAPSSVPVVTSEALSGSMLYGGSDARQNADRLRATFPEARVLLVTREQKSLLRSLYKSMVAWGNRQSIGQLLAQKEHPVPQEFHLDFLRFHLLAGHYSRLYGKENVLVLPYEMFRQTPREFLRRLFEHCGVENSSVDESVPLPFGRKVNRNVSMSAITFQRWLNSLSTPPAVDEERVQRVNRRMRNFPAVPWLDARLEKRFAGIVEQGTRGLFADSNQRLQSMAGLDLARYGYEMPGRQA